MRITLLLVLLIYVTVLKAQYYQNCDSTELDLKYAEDYLTGRLFTDYNKGKEYQYFGDWHISNVLLDNNNIVTYVNIRYNCLLGEFLWQRSFNGQVAILDKEIVRSVKMFDNNKVIMEFEKVNFSRIIGDDTTSVFLQVLAKGNMTLYARRKIQQTMTGEILKKDKYYLLHDNEMKLIVPKRVSLLLVMGGDKKKMRSVLRSKRILVRNEESLVKAIKEYNLLTLNE